MLKDVILSTLFVSMSVIYGNESLPSPSTSDNNPLEKYKLIYTEEPFEDNTIGYMVYDKDNHLIAQIHRVKNRPKVYYGEWERFNKELYDPQWSHNDIFTYFEEGYRKQQGSKH